MAYKELNEAALKKEPKGKYGLGLLYINGHGVPKNEKIALKYFKGRKKKSAMKIICYRGS